MHMFRYVGRSSAYSAFASAIREGPSNYREQFDAMEKGELLIDNCGGGGRGRVNNILLVIFLILGLKLN